MRLGSFLNAHLEVDTVADDVHFNRIDLEEQIAVVPIFVTHGIIVLRKSFVHQFLVIHIAFLHAEDVAQTRPITHPVSRIDSIAHPCEIAEKIFLTLVHLHIDVHVLGIVVPHAVFNDDGIAIAVFVVLANQVLLVGLPTFGRVLLRLKECRELASLVRLCECAFREESSLDLLFAQLLVALDDDIANLHLLLLVHNNVQNHVILLADIVALHDFDIGILESLIVEILLRQHLSAVDCIRMYAHASQQTQLLLHIVALALLQSDIVDSRDAGTSGQRDMQPNAIAYDGIGRNAHIREQPVPPIALHGVGDGRTRHFNLLTYGQSRDTRQHEIFIAFNSRHVDSTKNQRAGCSGIRDVGIDDFVLRESGRNKKREMEGKPCYEHSPTVAHLRPLLSLLSSFSFIYIHPVIIDYQLSIVCCYYFPSSST